MHTCKYVLMHTRVRTEHWALSLEDTQVQGRGSRRCPGFAKPAPPSSVPAPLSLLEPHGDLGRKVCPLKEQGSDWPRLRLQGANTQPLAQPGPQGQLATLSRELRVPPGPRCPARTIQSVTLSTPMKHSLQRLAWTVSQGHVGRRVKAVCARGPTPVG